MEEAATAKKNNGGVDIDRLSNLPDPLLLHILSFLPTITSVKTMSLVSHRYRNLWEQLQVFNFKDVYHGYHDKLVENFTSFSLFVNFVFARRRFHDIQKLRLSGGFSPFDKFSISSIEMWVGIAIGPHLEELHLALFTNKEYLFNFSLSIFTSCPNLVSLSFSGDISLQKLNCLTFCLPNYHY